VNLNFSNILNHPKTSIAGVLIGATTVAGVLSQQGITLGHAGTGTVVTLIAGIATALLGLFAKDPGSSSSSQPPTPISQSKLSVWMLVALLTMGMMPVMTGCTQQQKVSVAQEIVNWMPAFISTADTVNSSIEALDPVTALILGPLTAGINAFGPQIQLAAQNFLANPTETNLQLLQSLITQIQQNTNAALLAAAKITNPNSQALATKDVNLVATIANTILALVQSISTKTQVTAMSRNVRVTLAQVRPYMDAPALQSASDRVAFDLALNQRPTVNQFFAYEAQAGF
jgi:hypothetical protein